MSGLDRRDRMGKFGQGFEDSSRQSGQACCVRQLGHPLITTLHPATLAGALQRGDLR
jgi:hypothetical protein